MLCRYRVVFLLVLIVSVIEGFQTSRGCIRRTSKKSLRMDDEVARKGIKVELTTREEYLETRFTRLSASGHDLTPMLHEEVLEELDHHSSDLLQNRGIGERGLYCSTIGGLPIFSSGNRLDGECTETDLVFTDPCDEEHVEVRTNGDAICKRCGLMIGRAILNAEGKACKFIVQIADQKLRFYPLSKPFPPASQPESYWGSEDQYTFRRQLGGDE